MSIASSRTSPVTVLCLAFGLADLMFLNLTVFPRVRGEAMSPINTIASAPPPAAAPAVEPAPVAAVVPAPPPPVSPPPAAPPPRPLARPAVLNVREAILFPTGRSHIDKEGRDAIDRLATRLHTLPTFTLVVEGHADVRGEEDLNEVLSRNRAQAVVRRLVDQGVAPSRFTVRAFGSRRPATVGKDPESLQRNRRVEILLRGGTS